jgi:dihydroflavonol-4-reductase
LDGAFLLVGNVGKTNILITGATGFIGSHVAEALLPKQQYQLIAIARETGRYKNTDHLKERGTVLFQGEFWNERLLERIFKAYPIDSVIHLAALRGAGTGQWKDYYEINVRGTESLLQASLNHGVEKFIHCSSVGVYGTIPSDLPARLNTEFKGDSAYHRSKIEAEKKVQEFIQRGLNAFIVRPTIVYGPGDTGFPYKLTGLVRKRLLLLPLRENKIHLISVNRVADVIVRILLSDQTNKRIFLLADESPVSLKELADLTHFYYYGKKYPFFLRLPSFVYGLMLTLADALHNEKWTTRINLISKDWYYDPSETSTFLELNATDTKKEIVTFLETVR